MTEVVYSTVLDIPPDRAWDVIRDFGALPRWFPFVSQSVLRDGARPTEIGAVRDNTVDEGKIISEKLTELSDRQRRMAYALVGGDVPMTDYSSTLTIHEITEGGRTFAVWTAHYNPVGDPAPTEDWVRNGIFKTCLQELERVLKDERVSVDA